MRRPEHAVAFDSSDDVMKRSFEWAKAQAYGYVREGHSGGDAYEATLPGRNSFCMRDVSHQCIGAHFLGLDPHNRNMMRRFAEHISESKDWCTFWEITYDNEPCPADYVSDSDFWYNLPSGFDVVTSCGKLFDLTGDPGYLTDEDMLRFHTLTLTKYADRWDRDGDGIVDRRDSDGHRGIASYDESNQVGYRTAADTVALESAAFREGARIMRMTGNSDLAEAFTEKAEKIAENYRTNWWNDELRCYNTQMYENGTTGMYFTVIHEAFPVEYGLITDIAKLRSHMRYLVENEYKLNIEERCYLPAIFWKNGEPEAADRLLKLLSSEGFPRREYPEVSFSVVDAVVTGYMGLCAKAETRTVMTESRVPDGQWAEITDTPLWNGCIGLRHDGRNTSRLTNRTGASLVWKTCGKEITVENGETATVSR